MRPPRGFSALAIASVLAFALVLPGCSDDETVDPNLPPDNYISANTPINAVRRVMATYKARDRVSYLANLTTDFRFTFSPASDPDLVVVYGDDWNKTFEDLSTRHLYEGFTDGLGNFHPKAVRIDSDFLAASVSPDPNHPDSTRHYQVVDVPLLGIVWELEGDPNEVFGIESNYVFSVVRGDAAVLAASQPSDSTRWYLYRLDDYSSAVAASAGSASMPGASSTWGAVRAAYLQ